jgi:hypothetical protein
MTAARRCPSTSKWQRARADSVEARGVAPDSNPATVNNASFHLGEYERGWRVRFDLRSTPPDHPEETRP